MVGALMSYFGIKDLMLEIPAGSITNYSSVNKFGRNTGSTQDTKVDLWSGGGTYPFPATADITHIREAVDTVADRGAIIEVQGLNTDWGLTIQTVTLNASNSTTPVALTTALRRVFRMSVQSNVVLGSDIEIRNVGGGTTYGRIVAGVNQTQMAIYTVPSGYTAYVVSYFGSVAKTTAQGPTSCTFGLYAADRGNSYALDMKHEISTGGSGFANHTFSPYMKMATKTDIVMTSTCFDKAGSVNGGFDLILVKG